MEKFTDLKSVLGILKRRALFFLIPAIVILAGGSAVVMLLPAIYRSQATIIVESQQIPSDLVRSTVTALADERLQVIQQKTISRDNVLALAKKFSLFQNKDDVSASELADLVRERVEIASINLAKTGRRAANDKLVIAFTVSYEDESPQRAAGVANELVTSILSADAQARVTQAADTSRFLDEELRRLSGLLSEVEDEISKFRLDNAKSLPDKLAFNMSVNERTEKDISDIDRELQGIEETLRLLAFEENVRRTSGNGGFRPPQGQSQTESRIEALKADIATKSAVYAETHPEMRLLRRALAAMESEQKKVGSLNTPPVETDEENSGDRGGLETRLIREKMAALDGRIAFLKRKREQSVALSLSLKEVISRTPEIGALLGNLERRRASLQKSLDDVGEKLAKAKLGERLEEDQRSERFEVIEQPIVPTDPSRPDRKKYLAMVLAAAMAAGGGLAFATEFLDRRIRTSAELLSRVGIRPLGVIEFIPVRHEQRRKRWRWVAILLLLAIVITGSVFAVDYFYMPLELLFQKVMDRIDL
jgi:polysaccharide chain length determinant protein (PEP-CTERM system associated)